MPNISPKVHTAKILIHLPPRLKRKLKSNAKAAGCSQSEYVRRLIILSNTLKERR